MAPREKEDFMERPEPARRPTRQIEIADRCRRIVTALILPIAGLLLAHPAFAANLAGHWEGSVQTPGQELEVDLDFANDADTWTGDISIPAQGASDLPLESIETDGTNATFVISGIPGSPTFSGTFAGEDELSGNFTQGGQTFPFKLTRGASSAATAEQALSVIDDLILSTLEDWQTPGLGLAVVVEGEVILARGYGLRDVDAALPATENTLFAIGSSTKAFTTATLGTLVDEGKLDWDEPVRSYIPEFVLHDEYSGNHVTPRDLVTHRTGLPRHDLVWYGNQDLSRPDLVERLRYLQPNKELREAWQYNNLMYMTAGHLTERLTGQSWEDVVRDRILTPLGMSRSNFDVAESQLDSDHAKPYLLDDEELREVDFRPVGAMGPAGSINSSASEMAHWLICQLEKGQYEDTEILRPSTVMELHTPQMVLASLPTDPGDSPTSYSMGWFVDMFWGHLRVQHGGNIDGFSALVTLFPHDRVGIVALSNRNGDAVPTLISRTIAARLLEFEGEDWIGEAATQREQMKAVMKAGRENKGSFRKEGTKPSRKLAEFAGTYHHDGYGELEVVLSGKSLEASYNGMTLPLEHWHYDVFNVVANDDEIIPEDLRIVFQTNARGHVSGFAATLEPMVDPLQFRRLPDKKLEDPGFLSRLTGEYELTEGETLTVSLQGNVLYAAGEGQPPIALVPDGPNEFRFDEITGYSLYFDVKDSGQATALVAIQPNGVFRLERIDN